MSLLAFILLQVAQGPIPDPCDDPQTQYQMNSCAYEDYQKADKQLNEQWKITKEFMENRDETHQDDGRIGYSEALLTAQRDWLAYRDSHCVTEGFAARGGTLEPLLLYVCLAFETEKRTKALAGLAVSP